MLLLEIVDRICKRGPVSRNQPLRVAAFLFVIVSMIPLSAHAQTWSGILDPSRAVDWSSAGIPGGIPNYTTVCQTVAPSGVVINGWQQSTSYSLGQQIGDDPYGNIWKVTTAGTSSSSGSPSWPSSPTPGVTTLNDNTVVWTSYQIGGTDTYNIYQALKSCGATAASTGVGQVVQLQKGTYTSTGGLEFNGNPDTGGSPINEVVLRGAGPDQTILKFTGWGGCTGLHADICVMGQKKTVANYTGSAAWTGGYTKGTSVINVGSWTGTAPAVGSVVMLDQREDDIGICPASGGTGNCSGVSGATESGTTVTVTTSLPHGFAVGQSVAIGGVGVAGYNTTSNTSGTCNDTVGCPWWTITDVGCIVSGSYVTSSSCGANPIIAFQFTAASSGLASSGSGYAAVDNGGAFISGVPNAVIDETATNGRTCPDTVNPQCAAGETSRRAQIEVKTITACNGSSTVGTSCSGSATLTISPGLEMTNWRSSQAPGVFWLGAYDTNDGVEALTLDMTKDGSSGGGIGFMNCYECWVKNVRGINGSRNHVWLTNSARSEVVDSYFFGTKAGASKSYGVEANVASDDLIQNNVCQHVVACMIIGEDYGAVFSYNYAFDDGVNNTTWMYSLLDADHDYDGMDMFEGNDSNAVTWDNTHGTGVTGTFFRNRLAGQGVPTKSNSSSLRAVTNSAFMRANNFVGNILGTAGAQTNYQDTTTLFPPNVVYSLNVQGEHGYVPADSIVASSLLRWGNYDVVTGATRWCGNSSDPGWTTICDSTSEIPTTGITFIKGNAVPSSTTLPNSFYLSSQPNFWPTTWGTPPWPAIGPDVTASGPLDATCAGNPTACDGVAHLTYQIPAQICYNNTPIDPAYQQTFNVSGASWSSGTATLTIGSNTLASSNTVTVSGVSPSGYNGIFAVTSATSTTISYALPNNPGTYASGGAVTYPNILLFNAANCYPAAYGVSAPAPPSNLTAVAH